MVSGSSITFMAISLVLSIFFPIVLAIVFYRKQRYAISAVFIGVVMMTVSQFVIRIPLLQLSAGMSWYKSLASSLYLYALFLGLTAGLFEETARYIGFRFMLRKKLEWKNGVAYGIGHGGIESILLVGLTYINNLVYSTMINSGMFDKLISPMVPAETAKYIKDSLINTASSTFLVGGIERVLTMAVQIALSIIVLYAVANKKFIFYIYAILLHALVNIPAVILTRYVSNIWITEGVIFVFALISLFFIVKSRNFKFGVKPAAE